MIKSFRIVNNVGESITLDIRKPEDTGFLVSSVTGLTFPKADISMSEIAMFDGATETNERVGPRNIVMGIIFYDSNKDKKTIEELRHKCYRYFPIKRQVTFYVTNDSGTYWIKGYIEANEINIFSKNEAAQISILCPDPYFVKSSDGGTAYVSNIIPNFQFPVSFEYDGVRVDGYVKYTGPWVVVPKKTKQTLSTKSKYFYSDIVVTKVLVQRNAVNEGGGYTAYIKGSSTADITPDTTKEDPSIIFAEYEDNTSITPERADKKFNLTGTYTDVNLAVNAIPYTEAANSTGGTTVTFGKMAGNSFNPFAYTDYSGSYVFIPKKEDQVVKSAGKYLLNNLKVTKYVTSQETNSAGGYTLTVKGDTTYKDTSTASMTNSDDCKKYSGSYTIAPKNKLQEIATKAKYFDKDITISAIPNRWVVNTKLTDFENYTVYIGG